MRHCRPVIVAMLLATRLSAQSPPPSPIGPPMPSPPNPADGPSRPTVTVPAGPGGPATLAPPGRGDSILGIDKMPEMKKVGRWYFPTGKRGKRATVIFDAVVTAEGVVDPATVQLVETSDHDFVAPARFTLLSLTFKPGQAKGHAVRTLVRQAINYSTNPPKGCEVAPEAKDPPPPCQP